MAKVLMIASNYGLWAEELQAPWDALSKAGHTLTLATYKGITPLPIAVSVDPNFIDPIQDYAVNPPEVVNRVNEILDQGEWDQPIKITDANMENFDAIAVVGGPGAPLDITGNLYVHQLLLNAYQNHKLIGGICYAMAALAFTRDPDNNNKSIIYNRNITVHPREWDFKTNMNYQLVRTTPQNSGTDLMTQGFVFPLQYIVEDAVGDASKVISDPKTSRKNPMVIWDKPFVTATSVESAIAFGSELVTVLDNWK